MPGWAMAQITRLIAIAIVAEASDARAQGTPPPPPVWPMQTGLPADTGWFLALLVCTVALGAAWFF